ncbi:hypothetical protein M0657_007787 [Pyricularia oryzae]|nr:hypothetical protein M9X92_007497 [Pyricularia oryzae]KAI7918048.1 hypothetical protein M0657_007787 [Pyricularia oryzae]
MKLAAAGNSPLYIPLPLLMVEARSPVVPTTPYEGRAGPIRTNVNAKDSYAKSYIPVGMVVPVPGKQTYTIIGDGLVSYASYAFTVKSSSHPWFICLWTSTHQRHPTMTG